MAGFQPDSIPCEQCHGTGYTTGSLCMTCSGTGNIGIVPHSSIVTESGVQSLHPGMGGGDEDADNYGGPSDHDADDGNPYAAPFTGGY